MVEFFVWTLTLGQVDFSCRASNVRPQTKSFAKTSKEWPWVSRMSELEFHIFSSPAFLGMVLLGKISRS